MTACRIDYAPHPHKKNLTINKFHLLYIFHSQGRSDVKIEYAVITYKFRGIKLFSKLSLRAHCLCKIDSNSACFGIAPNPQNYA